MFTHILELKPKVDHLSTNSKNYFIITWTLHKNDVHSRHVHDYTFTECILARRNTNAIWVAKYSSST